MRKRCSNKRAFYIGFRVRDFVYLFAFARLDYTSISYFSTESTLMKMFANRCELVIFRDLFRDALTSTIYHLHTAYDFSSKAKQRDPQYLHFAAIGLAQFGDVRFKVSCTFLKTLSWCYSKVPPLKDAIHKGSLVGFLRVYHIVYSSFVRLRFVQS